MVISKYKPIEQLYFHCNLWSDLKVIANKCSHFCLDIIGQQVTIIKTPELLQKYDHGLWIVAMHVHETHVTLQQKNSVCIATNSKSLLALLPVKTFFQVLLIKLI